MFSKFYLYHYIITKLFLKLSTASSSLLRFIWYREALQNSQYFAGFKCIFLISTFLFVFWLNITDAFPHDYNSSLVWVKAWLRAGAKPLPKPTMNPFSDVYMCITSQQKKLAWLRRSYRSNFIASGELVGFCIIQNWVCHFYTSYFAWCLCFSYDINWITERQTDKLAELLRFNICVWELPLKHHWDRRTKC